MLLYAHLTFLTHWLRFLCAAFAAQSSLYHGTTGSPTANHAGGFGRKCTTSGQSVYPRIDPAVIMLVTCGDWCLLGRKAEWPQGRYSTLAGFIEVGEPLEASVVREVQVRCHIDSTEMAVHTAKSAGCGFAAAGRNGHSCGVYQTYAIPR